MDLACWTKYSHARTSSGTCHRCMCLESPVRTPALRMPCLCAGGLAVQVKSVERRREGGGAEGLATVTHRRTNAAHAPTAQHPLSRKRLPRIVYPWTILQIDHPVVIGVLCLSAQTPPPFWAAILGRLPVAQSGDPVAPLSLGSWGAKSPSVCVLHGALPLHLLCCINLV